MLHATIEVENETLEIDYTGSSPERPDAAVNCVFNTTFAHTIYPLKCSLLPDLPNNEGLFRPISVKAPPGSIVNCSYPAAVKARTKTSYHLHNAIYGALAPVLPRSVQAGSGSFWSIKFFGGESDSFRCPRAAEWRQGSGGGARRDCQPSPFPAMAQSPRRKSSKTMSRSSYGNARSGKTPEVRGKPVADSARPFAWHAVAEKPFGLRSDPTRCATRRPELPAEWRAPGARRRSAMNPCR